MKYVRGIALPDGDTHFEGQINANPLVGGKGTYQLSKLNAAISHVKQFGLAVDIGAHVGLWSRVLSRHFLQVHAFEPIPELIECAKTNLAGKNNVHLHPFALGEQHGLINMRPVDENSGNAKVDPYGLIEADVHTLDSMNFSAIDFIKIDVEGFEKFVIIGGAETIRRTRPVMIVEQKPGNAEVYGLRRREAIDLLEEWGAKVVWERAGDYCLKWT